jgi:hypothetical protein
MIEPMERLYAVPAGTVIVPAPGWVALIYPNRID